MPFKKLALILATAILVPVAQAADAWKEGVHYFRIPNPVATSSPGKVEVLDVFSYGCPACNAFEPTWNRVRASLPPQAKVAYVHAAFNPQEDWVTFQRAFLAAQALGVGETHHDAFYDAVWGKRTLAIMDEQHHLVPQSKMPTIQDIATFYAKLGVDREKFLAQASSFNIDMQMRRSDQLVIAAEVDSTPTIIVAGKYRVTPRSAGGLDQTVELVRFLVEREIHAH
jgi:thiol:disulfide interchange protein DsbA